MEGERNKVTVQYETRDTRSAVLLGGKKSNHISNECHSFATDKISFINTDFPVILEPEMGLWIG